MTEAIYQEVSVKTEKAKEQHRRISVCGMLKYLDVSRSGYRAWQRREPSEQQKHREAMKMRIKEKYDASKGIYGAPKITQELRQEGEHISERTVGLYMRQMGLRAVWVKHWTVTTKDSDFSHKLRNYLGEHFNPDKPNAHIPTVVTLSGIVICVNASQPSNAQARISVIPLGRIAEANMEQSSKAL